MRCVDVTLVRASEAFVLYQIVPSADHARVPKRSFRSLVASLLFHCLLALALWRVATGLVRQPSIFLMSSPGAPPGEVALDYVTSADPLPPAPQVDAGTDSVAEVRSLISKSLAHDSLSDTVRANFEPASVEFFGTRAYGNQFVYVLDISYSMKARRGDRFDRACNELFRSVSSLRPGQSYYVFLFSWTTEKMFFKPAVKYVDVAPGHAEELRNWVLHISLGAGTDPRRALALAHQLKPDAVFLLSDGHFNKPSRAKTESGWVDADGQPFKADVHEGVRRLYGRIPIHTVAFENPFTLESMQQIATATGGNCRYIETRSHEPIDTQRFLTALRHIDDKHRHDSQPRDEFRTRLSYAREFIRDGELAYAEYLVRPLRSARETMISNPTLLAQVIEILDQQLDGKRLEDFETPPELREILEDS